MLSEAGLYSTLQGNRSLAQFPLLGVNFNGFALGVSKAVVGWAKGNPVNLGLTGLAVGTVGSGVIIPATTKIVVPPNVPAMAACLSGAGFNGPLMPSIALVVSVSVAQFFTLHGSYSGVAPTVGTGQDLSKVTVANPATLIPMLMSSLGSDLGFGPLTPQLSIGLATGIVTLLLAGVGTGTVTGASGPAPSSGPTTSVVV